MGGEEDVGEWWSGEMAGRVGSERAEKGREGGRAGTLFSSLIIHLLPSIYKLLPFSQITTCNKENFLSSLILILLILL